MERKLAFPIVPIHLLFLSFFLFSDLHAQPYQLEYTIGRELETDQFRSVRGIAADAEGNVYVIDADSYLVKKFDPQGNPVQQWGGFGEGEGRFKFPVWSNDPIGITADATGNIYVSDSDNLRVQKFSPAGNFVTSWGKEGPEDRRFGRVGALDADVNSNIFVADPYKDRVQTFSSTGTFQSQWSALDNGNIIAMQGLALDKSGNVFLSGNNFIAKFSSTGSFLGKWGSSGSSDGLLNQPAGLVADDEGNILVADRGNNRVQKFSANGTFVSKFGQMGSGNGQFRSPVDIAIGGDGNLFVADSRNLNIQRFSSSGVFINTIGRGVEPGQFSFPKGVTTDASGNVYVVDSRNQRIQKFSVTGNYVSSFGGQGTGNGQFLSPHGIARDADGNVYVTDIDGSNYCVQKFSSSGTFIFKWGSNVLGASHNPKGIAVDGDGNIIVVGTEYRTISESVTTLVPYIAKFSPTGTKLWERNPSGEVSDVAVDVNGNSYVTSSLFVDPFHRITKYSPQGVAVADWTSNSFESAGGIAVDAASDVYVIDRTGKEIQKFTSTGNPIRRWSTSVGSNDYEDQFIAVDPNGSVYVSDPKGHRVIKQAIELSITSFYPGSGQPGAVVTLTGISFSSAPGGNTVKFNNVSAEVIECQMDKLVVRVPEGVTSGKISVTTGGKTAYSSSDFIVSSLVIVDSDFPERFVWGSSHAAASVSVNDLALVRSARFLSKGISSGDNHYRSDVVSIPSSGNSIEYTVPASYYNDPVGLEAYFLLEDDTGAEIPGERGHTYLLYPSTETIHAIPQLVFGSRVTDYQIISVPLDLTHKKVSDVFRSLGKYDKRKYRLYRYLGRNIELDGESEIEPGNGYWLIAKKGSIIVPGEGSTVAVTKENPFLITLIPGWNLIGNPYDFNVLWSEVLAGNGHPNNVGNLRQYKNGTFSETAILERYRGAFVYLQGNVSLTLKIPVVQNTSASGRVKTDRSIRPSIDSVSWVVPLTIDDGLIRNELAGIGMNPFASEELDVRDEVELPSPVASSKFALRRVSGKTVIRDVVDTRDAYTWAGELSSQHGATLSWDNSSLGSGEHHLVLVLPAQAEIVDMRNSTQVSLPAGTQTFLIHYGSEEYIRSSTSTEELLVGVPSPNPFKRTGGVIQIAMALPPGTNDIRLSLADLLGRTVMNSPHMLYEESHRRIRWEDDFSGLHPGVYVIRVTIGNSRTSSFYRRIVIE